jgi:methylated-DNA-[protein]-cysteine S-methyltransferase
MTATNIFSPSHSPTQTISIGMLSSSPIGPLWVAISERGLVAVDWDLSEVDFTSKLKHTYHSDVRSDLALTAEPIRQLSEYLAGIRCQFDITLDLSTMSPFQIQVLQLTLDIPYGQTSTYKEIAIRLGNPLAARAVGRVEATNPIPLIIPCHRIIGSDGSLHGYGGPGGIKLKAWLLNLEQTWGIKKNCGLEPAAYKIIASL